MIEKELQKQCENYLKLHDCIYIHLENQSRSKNRFSNTRKFKGFPDIVVFLKSGTYFFELKSETGKMKKEQIELMEKIEGLGYQYYLIRKFDQFKEIVDKVL